MIPYCQEDLSYLDSHAAACAARPSRHNCGTAVLNHAVVEHLHIVIRAGEFEKYTKKDKHRSKRDAGKIEYPLPFREDRFPVRFRAFYKLFPDYNTAHASQHNCRENRE